LRGPGSRRWFTLSTSVVAGTSATVTISEGAGATLKYYVWLASSAPIALTVAEFFRAHDAAAGGVKGTTFTSGEAINVPSTAGTYNLYALVGNDDTWLVTKSAAVTKAS